jgi:hypothetical protein
MPKPFQYYLLEEDGRSIHVENGVVTSSSTPTPIPHTPDKWQEITVGWERDMAKHGIRRNFSTGMEFIRDGAHILREPFYKSNVERRIYLLIQRLTLDLDSNFFRWVYRYFYKGEIDLSSISDADFTASINIMERKLVRMLNAFWDQVYEIDIENDPEMKTVKMDGMWLTKKQNWLIPEGTILQVLEDFDHIIGTSETTSEGQAAGFVAFTQYHDKNEPSNYATDIRYGFTVTQTINGLKIQGKIIVTDPNNDGDDYTAQLKTSEGNTIVLVPATALLEGPNTFIVDVTFNGVAGENFFFIGNYGGGSTSSLTYSESTISLSATTRYPTSYVKGLTAWTLYKRLVEKITGNSDYASSDLLEQYENIVITSGDAIRGISGARIKTSISSFFRSLDAVLCAGLGIENDKIVFKDRDHFYDESNPISLGNVKECKRTYAKEVMANTFKIGYPDSRIDDANGKYSSHNSISFTTAITRIVKEYSILSDYLTDPFLIESIRINLDGKTTTDSDSDNKTFMLNTEPEQDSSATAELSFIEDNNIMVAPLSLQFIPGQIITITGSTNNDRTYRVFSATNFLSFQFVVLETVPAGGSLVDEGPVSVTITWESGIIQKLLRVAYDEVEGIPEESIDTIFNIELFTPKRMLLRHGKWIRSMLWGFEMDKMTYRTTDKNPELKTTLGTEIIDEDADISIGELDEPLFIPISEECEGEVPVDLVEIFETSPNRCFEYIDANGLTRKGFNIKSALMPNTLQPQIFQFLSAKTNVFDELVQ